MVCRKSERSEIVEGFSVMQKSLDISLKEYEVLEEFPKQESKMFS